jgi:hypothetical protein
MSGPKPKITFLVGAGLVYDAGLPLSNDLTKKFREHLSEQVESNAKGNHALHLQVYRFLVGGIRYQQGVLNRDPDGPVNIEQLATAALRLKNRLDSPLAPYVSGWNQKLVELEGLQDGLLSDFLEGIYSRLNSWLTVEDSARIAYLARLSDFKQLGDTIEVFSLNYDLCIERALSEHSHGFVNGFTENGWTPTEFQSADMRLFKMHGSLDWVEDDVHGICSVTMPRHKYADDFEGQKPPLLIFGTDAKLTGKEPFLNLLHSFSSSLHDSDVLIVIGYSFQDDYLNEIIEQRMNRTTRLKIIVVSPRATDGIRRVKFLAGSPRVKTIDAGAKTALNDGILLKACRDVTAAQKDEAPF